jgi:hypothetical protein
MQVKIKKEPLDLDKKIQELLENGSFSIKILKDFANYAYLCRRSAEAKKGWSSIDEARRKLIMSERGKLGGWKKGVKRK